MKRLETLFTRTIRQVRPERSKALTAEALRNPHIDLEQISDPAERLDRRIQLWSEGARIQSVFSFDAKEAKAAKTARRLVTLAAISAEVGYYTQAFELVDRAVKADPEVLSHLRFLGLTTALGISRPDIKSTYASEIAEGEKLKARAGSFRRLVLENRGSIAIVGNAPSELGKKTGEQIDACDLVIRFNNFSVDPEFAPDYGTKTDVWVRNARYRQIWRRAEAPALHIIADNIYWRKQNGQDVVIDAALDQHDIEEYPLRIFNDALVELGTKPSAGIRMLLWLDRILGNLDGVLVRGFNLVDQTEKLSHYYTEPRHTPVPHDWISERRMFDRLLKGEPAPPPPES